MVEECKEFLLVVDPLVTMEMSGDFTKRLDATYICRQNL